MTEPGSPGLQDLVPPDRTSGGRRVLTYLGLSLLLLLLIPLGWFRWTDWVGGAYLHTLLETIATVLALVVGALGLVRFYSRKQGTYLFLGTGFLATGFLDGYHSIVTSPLVTHPLDLQLEDLTVWTWIASRVFLSLFLFVSWVAWFQEEGAGASRSPSRPIEERSVYGTAALLTLVIFVFFAAIPLSEAYHPDRVISRPAELIPGLFFLLALLGYLRKGEWRSDPFEHWLVLALILSIGTQLSMLAYSTQLYDAPGILGHLLKIMSYAALLTGLLISVYVTFRREGEVSKAVLDANAALAQEVAVRREAERVLVESEEVLQDFLDNATDLIQSTDAEGRILYVNEAWKRTLGYSDEEIRETNLLSIIHPDSREHCRLLLTRLFKGEELPDFEVIFVARSGRPIICSGSTNCRFENGVPVATRSILRNVTEERRAGGELARSQANMRALFESTGDAIWSVDRELRLLTFNTAYALTMEAMSGRAPVIGDAVDILLPETDREWFHGCYDRALAGTRFSAVREEALDGHVRVYELFFNPIEAEDGSGGVVVFSKDITRRRRVEEALRRAKQEAEEANQAKSQFLANMSHELRTPLNSVIGFANILLKNRGPALEARERGFLERILANGKHLLGLINEILDLSKIEAGRMEVQLESVDLALLIQETLSQLEGQVAGKPVELRSEFTSEASSFLTDAGKLKQVLINLVGNALKFTESGEVVVAVEVDTDRGVPRRIQVRDTGVGIPPERLDAVFDAFQQADGSTTRRFGGTGLGLTISRSLCHLLGYGIRVDSTLGKGSTFTIELAPARLQVTGEEGVRELDAPPLGRWAPQGFDLHQELEGKTVLVIDDEADSRTLLAHYLEDLGCRVVTAADGVEGLEVARREEPALITVDLMMPRMSGWEMLRALRQDPDLRDIPAIVVSIVAEEGTGSFLGAVDLLTKPVDRDELHRVLRRNISQEVGRVLIVDDNPDTRLILQRYLREAGLVTTTAESGPAAIEILQRSAFDLVILDLVMPGMDGFLTLRRVREERNGRTVPILILTAKDLTEEERRILSVETTGIVRKDLDVEAHLREVLDRTFGAGPRPFGR